jgi:hypothetical protein
MYQDRLGTDIRKFKENGVSAGGEIGYECTVKNTGSVAGDAVVLGFANSTDPQVGHANGILHATRAGARWLFSRNG